MWRQQLVTINEFKNIQEEVRIIKIQVGRKQKTIITRPKIGHRKYSHRHMLAKPESRHRDHSN